uniref:Uncharacterized protein n=1 Tax=Anopheles quadriannulatus TaxID=34691 RepID=A0A182XR05_ANOQN
MGKAILFSTQHSKLASIEFSVRVSRGAHCVVVVCVSVCCLCVWLYDHRINTINLVTTSNCVVISNKYWGKGPRRT